MSSVLKRNEELGRKYHIRAETPRTSLVFGDFGHTAAAVVFKGPRVAEVVPGSAATLKLLPEDLSQAAQWPSPNNL